MIGIYKITSPTGKVYIGQTNNIEKRKSYYRNANCKNQKKLYHSLLKYGFDSHRFDILCECSIDELTEKEEYYITLYDSINNGLNLKGAGPHGKLSDDVRNKISIGNKGLKKRLGHKNSEYQKQAVSNFMKGRKGTFTGHKHTDEAKNKIANANRGNKNFLGKKHTEETKKLLSDQRMGIKLSESHKKSLSVALTGNKIWLGKKHSPESIEKMRLVKLGKKASEETKRKMSESAKIARLKRRMDAGGKIETESMAI